jgi:hypothetical protein
MVGPAAYNRCQSNQLSQLSTSPRPNLSSLSPQERDSIESACSYDKAMVGPAAYNRCLSNQLSQLSTSPRPNLSSLSPQERDSIESACSYDKAMVGPAAYNRCLSSKLSEFGGLNRTASAQLGLQENPSKPTTQEKPIPSTVRKRLAYFAGDWTLVGDVQTTVFGPGGKLKGSQRNQLGSDGTVLSYWDEERPSGKDSGQGTYTFDADSQDYVFDSVSTTGEKEHSLGTVEGDTWTWESNPTTEGGDTMKGRFTVRQLSNTSYSFKFEVAAQGGEWTKVTEGLASKSH